MDIVSCPSNMYTRKEKDKCLQSLHHSVLPTLPPIQVDRTDILIGQGIMVTLYIAARQPCLDMLIQCKNKQTNKPYKDHLHLENEKFALHQQSPDCDPETWEEEGR